MYILGTLDYVRRGSVTIGCCKLEEPSGHQDCCDCFYKLGILFVGVLIRRALLFGTDIRATFGKHLEPASGRELATLGPVDVLQVHTVIDTYAGFRSPGMAGQVHGAASWEQDRLSSIGLHTSRMCAKAIMVKNTPERQPGDKGTRSSYPNSCPTVPC